MDVATPTMVFGRMVLIGDAAFSVRPHTGAGTLKAFLNSVDLGQALNDAITDASGPPGGGGVPYDVLQRRLQEWDRKEMEIGRYLVWQGMNRADETMFPRNSPELHRTRPPFAPEVQRALEELTQQDDETKAAFLNRYKAAQAKLRNEKYEPKAQKKERPPSQLRQFMTGDDSGALRDGKVGTVRDVPAGKSTAAPQRPLTSKI